MKSNKKNDPARPLKIFVYGMNYAPELMGVGRYSGELCSYLAAQGMAVEVVTTAPHYPGWTVKQPYSAFAFSREEFDGVRVNRCPIILRAPMRGIWRMLAPLSFAVLSAPWAFWRVLRQRPDTILAIEPTLLVAPLALIMAKLVRARAVLHVQDLEVDAAFAVGHLAGAWLKRAALAFERFLLSRFDQVVTISEEMRLRLMEKGVAQGRLHIIRNWVDVEKIVPMPNPSPLRAQLGIPESRFVALYAGNVGAKQALHVVLEAAAQLAREHHILFVIAGEGPEKESLLQRFGHLTTVRFLPPQPEELLCALLNVADIHLLPQGRNAADLVMPSKLGGMLASGRQVLASCDPDTELYRFLDGEAIIVPSGDSERMAQAILAAAKARKPPSSLPSARVSLVDARILLPKFAALMMGSVR